MTKILVFSDSHGETEDMRYIIDTVHPDAEYVLHLGDGAAEFERLSPHFPRQAFVGVSGNCDWSLGGIFGSGGSLPYRVLNIDGRNIFMCHGHRHGVKSGDNSLLIATARSLSADIVLFGHTHYSEYSVVSKSGGTDENSGVMHVMNPGSVSRPRGGQINGKSYGIIVLDGKGGVKISLHEV